jgi:hypothetical protein
LKLNALQASKRIDLLDTVTHRFTLEQVEGEYIAGEVIQLDTQNKKEDY